MAKKEEKNPNGRPPKYKAVEELEEVIQTYFDECQPKPMLNEKGKAILDVKGNPVMTMTAPTITGLALALGFLDRKSVYDYKEKEKFAHTIKKARLVCEQFIEQGLVTGGIAPAGAIFILKNYGWRDKQEIEMNATINRVKYDEDDEEL